MHEPPRASICGLSSRFWICVGAVSFRFCGFKLQFGYSTVWGDRFAISLYIYAQLSSQQPTLSIKRDALKCAPYLRR